MELIWRALADAAVLIFRLDAELIAITLRSLWITTIATLVAACLAIPLGVYLGLRPEGRFRRTADLIVDTGMALPPVLVGLLVMILLWRSGPLGALRLLYTPSAMIMAQSIVAFPLVAAITRNAIASVDPALLEAARALGATGARLGVVVVQMKRSQISTAIAAGFGRAISEVGASLMVGANIAGETRVLTTAITLESSRGEFSLAIALGIVLLVLALLANTVRLLIEGPPARSQAR